MYSCSYLILGPQEINMPLARAGGLYTVFASRFWKRQKGGLFDHTYLVT